MQSRFNRRQFLGASAAVGAAGFTAGVTPAQEEPDTSEIGPGYPSTSPELTREMVGACHGRVDRVRELLAQDRSLALATWDWGFGDWESALGAASHTGNREIAELLLAEGSRPNLFTLAMLDHVDVVRAICVAIPGVQENLGPHGISLMSHAKQGNAILVEEYLQTLGGADGAEPGEARDDAALERFTGSYFAEGNEFIVTRSRHGWLTLEGKGKTPRVLRRHNDLEFSPAGAPHVHVIFSENDGGITGLTIMQGARVIKAEVGMG